MIAPRDRQERPPMPDARQLLDEARRLFLAGFPLQCAATTRTSIEIAIVEVSAAHEIRVSRKKAQRLTTWAVEVCKFIQFSKAKRTAVARFISLGNLAAHGTPISLPDCVRMMMVADDFITAAGIARDAEGEDRKPAVEGGAA